MRKNYAKSGRFYQGFYDDLIAIGITSRKQLTSAIMNLYEKFLDVDYKQLPLPLQFESEGRQLPMKFE